MAQLLGPDGRPITRASRPRPQAVTTTGIASPWTETVAGGITPYRLASILRAAADGDGRAYALLAEEMEERDPHYASVLGTRKRAVSGLDLQVEAHSDKAQDLAIADAVRDMLTELDTEAVIEDLSDGFGKGYSVARIEWQWGKVARPVAIEHVPAHLVLWDRTDGKTPLIPTEANPMGERLEPFGWIFHAPRLKTGLPLRGGLARLVAAAWMCKAYGLRDWLAWAEVYGMPLRVGRYGASATEDDIATLVSAVANVGSDAAAVIPESMRIEFIEAARGSATDVFERLATYLDKQVSKAVLGQTMSTDDGASLAQARVHDEVRTDIQISDAKQIARTLRRDLVAPFVAFNFGAGAAVPMVALPVPEPEDTKALVDAIAKLVPLGFRVEQSIIRDKLGIPDPAADARPEDLLSPMPAAPVVAANARAANAAADVDDLEADLGEIEREGLADWEAQMTPVIDPIRDLAARVDSFEAFEAGLADLIGKMDTDALTQSLARAMWLARARGDVKD
ncbi:DUF935 domain-containing protein (plasmid) [Tistrella mobilis]|uniref:DUF935 domain-containing protein n=1 Tax=Tistrella mobilis TaxID=171437 RepID=UPI003557DE59